MPVNKNIDQETLEDLESSLTEELEEIREHVLYIASDIVERDRNVSMKMRHLH